MTENWVFITSLFISIFSILGFIYSYFYYNTFSINYLDHADISDLFGVLFVHPFFLISFIIVLLGFNSIGKFFSELELTGKESQSKYKNIWLLGKLHKNRFNIFGIVFFIFVIFSPIWIVSNKIDKIKNTRLPIHKISYNKNSTVRCAVSIGSTSTNLFYWDIISLESIIIPKKQIVKITIILPKPPEKKRAGRPTKPPLNGEKTEFQKSLIKWNNELKNKCG